MKDKFTVGNTNNDEMFVGWKFNNGWMNVVFENGDGESAELLFIPEKRKGTKSFIVPIEDILNIKAIESYYKKQEDENS